MSFAQTQQHIIVDKITTLSEDAELIITLGFTFIDSHIKLSLNGDISLNPEHPVAHKEPGLPVRKSSSPRRLVRQKVTHFNGIEPMGNSEC